MLKFTITYPEPFAPTPMVLYGCPVDETVPLPVYLYPPF